MTQLDGTAVREIERLVSEAQAVVVPDAERRQVYFLRQPDGSLQERLAPAVPKSFKVFDLTSLRAARDAHSANAQATFVADNLAAVVCTDKEHQVQYRVELPLPQHPSFQILNSWTQGKRMDQKALIRLLRTQLSKAVDASVISQLKSVKFRATTEGESVQTHSRSEFGQRISREVQNEQGGTLIESFPAEVPVYDVPEYREDLYAIEVLLDYDHDQGEFVLTAVSDDVKDAQEQAVSKIQKAMETSEMPVYYGEMPTLSTY